MTRARKAYNLDRLGRGSTAHHRDCHTRTDIRTMAGFDPETFQQIRSYAINNKLTMAAAIRELVEFGLEDIRG